MKKYLIIFLLLFVSFCMTCFCSNPGFLSSIPISQCRGIEPFWHISFSTNALNFSAVDSKKQQFIVKMKPLSARGYKPGTAMAFVTTQSRASRNANKKSLTLLINKNACASGASEVIYPYQAFVIFPDKLLLGCCS